MRAVALAMNEPIGTVAVVCQDESPLLALLSLVLPLIAAHVRNFRLRFLTVACFMRHAEGRVATTQLLLRAMGGATDCRTFNSVSSTMLCVLLRGSRKRRSSRSAPFAPI